MRVAIGPRPAGRSEAGAARGAGSNAVQADLLALAHLAAALQRLGAAAAVRARREAVSGGICPQTPTKTFNA